MPNDARVIYWDSNVFTSFINKMPDRIDIIRDVLAEISEDFKSIILTSSESIVEVTHCEEEREQGKLDPEIEILINDMWEDTSIVKIIENGLHIAPIAHSLIRDAIPQGWVLKPKDAVHLASALWYDRNIEKISEFHTYDKGIFKYQAMIGILIEFPNVLQHRLKLEADNAGKKES